MKKKVIIAFALLMVCMSSCVFSLFPIYTKEDLVYLPELEGKWSTGDSDGDYLVFESGSSLSASVNISESRPENEPRVKKEWSVTFDHDEYIVVKGDTIRDPAIVKAYWEGKMEELNDSLAEGMDKLMTTVTEKMTDFGKMTKKYDREAESYIMSVYENGVRTYSFLAHLVEIGDDYFLDLYPEESIFEFGLASNLFPVHTFMKLELEDDQLNLVRFDLEKLNKLFDSNLIRLRHENVDGSILITAQPKEIQKFLDKYADDESVFDDIETYQRVN